MDSKQHTARVRDLLQTAHELHQRVSATMTELGDDAGALEWQTLYSVMNAVGIACDIMRETMHPHPSMFTDAEVPMVCTSCRQPAEAFNTRTWQHAEVLQDSRCETGGLDIKVMVAAGNEKVAPW